MAVEIVYHEDAKRQMLTGVDCLADVIKATLGPKGRTAVVQSAGVPLMTSSAAAIVKDFALEDPVENMGAQMICEAVSKTEDAVGGGAATAAVLTQYIVREGFRNIAAGANPAELKKGIQGAAQLAAAAVKKLSKPAGRVQMAHAAAVSSGDPAIGELVAEAVERAGRDGAVTVEESGGREASLHAEEGIQFERGLLSPHMITDRERMVAELEDPYILVTDQKITSALDLLFLLEQVAAQGRSLLIIADGVEGEALGMLVVNAQSGTLRVAAVMAPAYGDGRRAMLEDIAVFTGGEFISPELGYALREATVEQLGSAASVKIDRRSTVITGGRGRKEPMAERVQSLRAMLEKTEYDFDRQRLEERLAKLTGGAVSIRVGAATEPELKEKKRQIEAALRIARAAQAEGVVPGGGVGLLNTAPAVRAYAETLSGDRKTGAKIILGALEVPLRQIAENAGLDGGAVLGELKRLPQGTGFDVMTGQYGMMEEAGIVDAARAVRFALLHAASVSAVLLTAEAGVTGTDK